MNAFLLRLKKIDDRIGALEMGLCCLLVIAMVSVTGVGIFFRYVLRSPLIAGMNLASLMLVWLTFFGASAIYKNKGHMSLDILVDRFTGTAKKSIKAFVHALVAVIFFWTARESLSLIFVQRHQQIVALGISRIYLTIPVIVASVFMGFTSVLHVLGALFPIQDQQEGK